MKVSRQNYYTVYRKLNSIHNGIKCGVVCIDGLKRSAIEMSNPYETAMRILIISDRVMMDTETVDLRSRIYRSSIFICNYTWGLQTPRERDMFNYFFLKKCGG